MDLFPVGSLVRFDGNTNLIGRIVSIRISEGDVVHYEVEWDSEDKGNFQTHTFHSSRLTQFDLEKYKPLQIGFGGCNG